MARFKVLIVETTRNERSKVFEATNAEDAQAQAEAEGWETEDGWIDEDVNADCGVESVTAVTDESPT